MPEHLFVYGTLAPGRPNAHVLAEVPGTWRPATISDSPYEPATRRTFRALPSRAMRAERSRR